ncbi:tRNA glutamyl-Q(34) synthetase GluQRS [Parvularcula marina]|uniref:tRNA glutamyl-Q(34) synthetase GluQRS n=1 Tax=Parvularcula marina TaxID=2292771 RepID=UPI0035159904
MSFVTRFAPSPTGHLHLGHAYSAILTWQAAVEAGGSILLRIEDIDRGRCRFEYEVAIIEDLGWLGLTFDSPIWRQSERLADYEARLETLIKRGLVYRCFKTRKELEEMSSAPHGPLGAAYSPGPMPPSEEEALLAKETPFAWRLDMKAVREESGAPFDELTFLLDEDGTINDVPASAARFGDVVLGRKDVGTSYHLASVHDDIESGITHIIRGEDLAEAAGLHRLLYALFEAPPPIYRHHPLITDEDGKRLAKRDKAATLADMRARGASPLEVYARLGLTPPDSLQE